MESLTLQTFQAALGWTILLNYAVLTLWLLYFLLAHDHLYRVHSRMFDLSVASFNKIHYAGMAFYKLSVFIFMLAPYLALRIVV